MAHREYTDDQRAKAVLILDKHLSSREAKRTKNKISYSLDMAISECDRRKNELGLMGITWPTLSRWFMTVNRDKSSSLGRVYQQLKKTHQEF